MKVYVVKNPWGHVAAVHMQYADAVAAHAQLTAECVDAYIAYFHRRSPNDNPESFRLTAEYGMALLPCTIKTRTIR